MCGGGALCNALPLSQGDGVYRCPHTASPLCRFMVIHGVGEQQIIGNVSVGSVDKYYR